MSTQTAPLIYRLWPFDIKSKLLDAQANEKYNEQALAEKSWAQEGERFRDT